jgi:hypothetical protein
MIVIKYIRMETKRICEKTIPRIFILEMKYYEEKNSSI